ncbi:hypothetical protein [Verminephrobacter eiseniae]|uniref:hypothetical protein n=1 Tax=Verminephrobacter eiseniae TaxID=364317 RepID=UPI002242C894|nr:hypothetical protein [Verminephrobacter eiseniae]
MDEIVGFDVARLAQTGDDFLDQLRVILGELDRHGGDALAVGAEHAQLLARRDSSASPAIPEGEGRGRSRAARGRFCTVGAEVDQRADGSLFLKPQAVVTEDARDDFAAKCAMK